MENKKTMLESEANLWFRRNKEALVKKGDEKLVGMLCEWLMPFNDEIQRIAEIGSGSGHKLNQMCKELGAQGDGVEPSEEAVDYANETFDTSKYIVGAGDKLELPSNHYDVVHLGFFLYLVDRHDYLKCISEADRILKEGRFLSIIDFDPLNPYANKYAPREGLRSFKLDNSQSFLGTGNYYLVNKFSFSHSAPCFAKEMNERVSLMLLYKEKQEDAFGVRE